MQKWEYFEISRTTSESRDGSPIVGYVKDREVAKDQIPFYPYLKKMGEDGWELVSYYAGLYVFKRPLP